ncbi:MAG: autotransporter-associated beta strand repeat-containing protein, partial [Kiritimatiellae bacterium]|nr:autotransporter-associated beta strand repeat-containing protein [Kiritimatiellia bacterium]
MRKTASALLAAALLGASVSGETMSFAPAGTFTVNTNIAITGATTVDVASGTVVFAGVVSGSGGLTKRGAGTLYLANRANTYDGLMTVSAGALYCRSFAPVTLNGGSLRLYGSGMFETDQPIHQGGNSQVYVSDATDTLVVNGPWTGRCALRGAGTCRFMRCLTASDISTCVRTDKGVTEFLYPTNSFTCNVTANDGTFRVVTLAGKGVP